MEDRIGELLLLIQDLAQRFQEPLTELLQRIGIPYKLAYMCRNGKRRQ